MNRELVGEPGVSAFLRSVRQNLGRHISRIKPNYTTYLYYDPTKDLEKLKEKLIFFQDLVVDGEARRLNEECVDEWMDDIKHLLYDIEDTLEYLKSLNNDQVCIHELYTTSNEKREILFKILNKTELLRDRATDLELKRGSRYALREDSKVTLPTRETSSELGKSGIFGRSEDQNNILNWSLKENDAHPSPPYDVLCIVGMEGLGKTTLAKQVFNDPQVVKHFHVRSWVCLSNDLDVARATKELIEYSGGGGSLGDQTSLPGLQMRLKEMVRNKRFLFVFDDVWSSSEWEKLTDPFSSCANGSKILVTTSDIKITPALSDNKPHELKELDHERCMELFFRGKVASLEDEQLRQEKENLAKNIVRACAGNPFMVKMIWSVLKEEDVVKWRAVSENAAYWANKNDGIHPALKFCYYYLSASLKRCFEYLAMFPRDYKFQQDDVVRLWIAEGLVQDVDGRMAEDIGNEYYDGLKAVFLIRENDTMHEIVHHLASLVSRKFCYNKNSKEPLASVRHAFLVNSNSMHYEFLDQTPYLRTLIVEKPKDEIVLQKEIRSCNMVRALKIDGISDSRRWELSLGGSFIDHLTHIRYLSIRYSNVRYLPDSLCMLDNLQFLDLSRNKDLEKLPDRMNHLSNLRHLIISFSSVSSLPESICDLSRLQLLNLKGCRGLKQLPKDIGNLKSLRILDLQGTSILSVPESILNITGLEKLGVDEDKPFPVHIESLATLEKLLFSRVRKDMGRRLGELTKLNLLKRLGEQLEIAMDNIGGVEEAKIANLKGKKNVRELEFHWSQPGTVEEMEVKIMEAFEPHPALESLTFYNYGGNRFPAWIMRSNICLSNLVNLKMEGLNKICEMIEMEFVLLERLSIENCPKLRKVLMATPKLARLSIMKCGELEADSLHLLSSLSDKAGLLSIFSQLEDLHCAYNIFE